MAQGPGWRVVRVADAAFPGYYRVIWSNHVAEFSDLSPAEQRLCMGVVAAVEQTLRTEWQPTKMNLASLGNMVPHLHWHVLARFDWDSHFPHPIWASPQRPVDTVRVERLIASLPALDRAVAQACAALVAE